MSIKFNVIDWNEYDNEICDDDDIDHDESLYTIEAFGRTNNDKTIYLKISGYTPYFFVEIPRSWKSYHLNKFALHLKKTVYYKFKESLIQWEIKKKHKLYGFTAGKRFKFAMLVFNSSDAMRSYKYLLKKKMLIRGLTRNYDKYPLYESNISPLLRFMHIQNINASGWIKVKKKKMYGFTRKRL